MKKKLLKQFLRLEEDYAAGKITDAEAVDRGDKLVKKAERQCGHKATSTETGASGAKLTWCDDCGARLDAN